MGSTSSCTPPFSTQKSPSSMFSSKVKPYWKPEQPPPDTNTRSFRFGLASSLMSSPTLPAAASVKTSTWGGGGLKVVVSMGLVYSGLQIQSKPWAPHCDLGTLGPGTGLAPVHQFAINL